MTAFLTARKCACGHTLWAVMGEPTAGWPLLVTFCPACDLTSRANVSSADDLSVNDSGPATGTEVH